MVIPMTHPTPTDADHEFWDELDHIIATGFTTDGKAETPVNAIAQYRIHGIDPDRIRNVRPLTYARAPEWNANMDEAPRDGTPLLLATSWGVCIGWWEDNEPKFKWRFVDDFDLSPTGCCDMESEDRVPCNGMEEDGPTHWRNLPQPPKEQG